MKKPQQTRYTTNKECIYKHPKSILVLSCAILLNYIRQENLYPRREKHLEYKFRTLDFNCNKGIERLFCFLIMQELRKTIASGFLLVIVRSGDHILFLSLSLGKLRTQYNNNGKSMGSLYDKHL